MRLDVVVPTYNREELLSRTLRSLLTARVPTDLTVGITVVDNNSSDRSHSVVKSWQAEFAGRLNYVFEPRQGRSHALNAGIDATDGDLIGFIDDDEEIEQSWYECVYAAFSSQHLDFIGGPYIPRWEVDPPPWLPRDYCGVIGWIDAGETPLKYDESYPGILMGGNAVLTRSMLNKVGKYLTSVSRNGNKLLAGEDEDMYHRLLTAGAKGLYLPSLKIFHYVPAERLTKRYFRRWCFWRGVSSGVLDRSRPLNVSYMCGVPKYLYGNAMRGALANLVGLFKDHPTPDQRFSRELATWDLLGFFYGKHVYGAKEIS